MDIKEKRFEQDIESFLVSKKGGYEKGDMSTFDKKKAIDMSKLISFISSTHPTSSNAVIAAIQRIIAVIVLNLLCFIKLLL